MRTVQRSSSCRSVCPALLLLSGVVLVLLTALPASAIMTLAPPSKVNRYDFNFVANWTFDLNNDEPFIPTFTQANPAGAWSVLVDSPASTGGGAKDVSMLVQHPLPPHAGEGPKNDGTITLTDITRPATGVFRKATAMEVTHPGAVGGPHFDIIRLRADIPAVGNGVVAGSGMHTRSALATYSFLGITGQVKVTVPDADGNPITIFNQQTQARQHIRNPLVDPTDPNRRVNQYTVSAAIGGGTLTDPASHTTLAFLGDVDGTPGEMDFITASELFAGDEEFEAPMFMDDANQQELYIGIDLTQFLSFDESFSLDEDFTFSGGENPDLPGVIVGTSPITFDPGTGEFVTANPATGTFRVDAFIDGGALPVPEPSPMILAVAGVASLVGLTTRRRARV